MSRKLISALIFVSFLVGARAAFRAVRSSPRDPAPAFPVECVDESPAWDFPLRHADGTTTALNSLRGRPLVVHFWASWSPPDVRELPLVLALKDEVIAVSVDDDDAALQKFFKGNVPTRVVRDVAGAARHLKIDTVPDTWVLDARGIPRAHFTGPRDWKAFSPVDIASTCPGWRQ